MRLVWIREPRSVPLGENLLYHAPARLSGYAAMADATSFGAQARKRRKRCTREPNACFSSVPVWSVVSNLEGMDAAVRFATAVTVRAAFPRYTWPELCLPTCRYESSPTLSILWDALSATFSRVRRRNRASGPLPR